MESPVGRFDLDDVGAHVAQRLGREGAEHDGGESITRTPESGPVGCCPLRLGHALSPRPLPPAWQRAGGTIVAICPRRGGGAAGGSALGGAGRIARFGAHWTGTAPAPPAGRGEREAIAVESDRDKAAAPVSPRTVLLIVASAMFMEQLDGTVLATALPAMARSFHAEPLQMNIALTSYLLTLAMFIPASGRMADRFGSRTVFRAAIALFTLGSILCAQAPSLWALVAARMLQGAGGAMMSPVGRLVMLRVVSKAELVRRWPG